jgi:protein involved in polysaccharide export with SLBB domain
MKLSKLIGRWGSACVLLVAALSFVGCQSDKPSGGAVFADPVVGVRPTGTNPASVTPVLPVAPAIPTIPSVANPTNGNGHSKTNNGGFEIINIGEPLIIVFSDLPVPLQPFEERVKEDGTITLLHNQTFQSAGKRRGDLEREIHDRYVPSYYVNLTVTVKQMGRFYFVDGEVKQPNRYIYEGRTTVLSAIASAGGFTDWANKKKVLITRADRRKETVNCTKALQKPELDLEIFPGDKVHVSRSIF